MIIDPIVLTSITAAISLLGRDYANGLAGEAGKATWIKVKALLGWHSDPPLSDIPRSVVEGLTASPEITEALVRLLKQDSADSVRALVRDLTINNGKVVFAQIIHNINM